ncbi:hypothetical protein L4C34_15735 [Vibrio profundum]|uniref:hypothetical protein n=1 Tax=Vibrio profundum TaxID=2910247 RepID=UPI003D0D4E6C
MITTLYVAILSYLLKVIPFSTKYFQSDGTGFIARSVEYAVCFIMGTIIINVAFGNESARHLAATFGSKDWVILATIFISFFVCRRTGSILKSLLVSMTFFIIAIWGQV